MFFGFALFEGFTFSLGAEFTASSKMALLSERAAIAAEARIASKAATTATEGIKAATSELPILADKLKYAFGKATGTAHNIGRSKEMLRQLENIGIFDNAAGNAYLRGHFGEAFNASKGVLQRNGRYLRNSFLIGPNGGLGVESIWEGSQLVTYKFFGKPNSWYKY